jgi:tetratricopeptide (TPR) repeat protein
MTNSVFGVRRVLAAGVTTLILTTTAGPAFAQGSRVIGIVRDEAGQPIKGATLSLENPDAIPRNFTASSDERGRFAVIGLKSGEWSVVAQAPGFLPDATRVLVRASTPAAPMLTLRRAPQALPSILGSVGAKDLQAELKNADQQFNAQQWEQAIASYRTILAKAPALNILGLQIGAAYRNKKDYDNAIAAYNELLKADPASDKARVGLGLAYMEKGDLAAAASALSAAAQAQSASKEVLYSLAEIEAARGKTDDATSWYQKASASDPNWGKPLLKLGMTALQKGDRANAATMMQRVVAVDPTSAEATQARTVIEQLR